MKKTAFIAAILAAATLMTACGVEDESSDNKAASSGSQTTEQTTEETTEEETTEEVTTAEPTTEPESETETASTEATASADPDSDVYSQLAGYWFVDGDSSLANIHITPTGRFESFYANGNPENSGFIKREKSEESEGYVIVFYSEQGEKIMTSSEDKTLDADTFYINESNTCFKRLFFEGGLGDDGRDPVEDFFGHWENGTVTIDIDEFTQGTYYVEVIDQLSENDHIDWTYVCTYEDGKLVCSSGSKLHFTEELEADNSFGLDNFKASAEFSLEKGGLVWTDKDEHYADDKVFKIK